MNQIIFQDKSYSLTDEDFEKFKRLVKDVLDHHENQYIRWNSKCSMELMRFLKEKEENQYNLDKIMYNHNSDVEFNLKGIIDPDLE